MKKFKAGDILRALSVPQFKIVLLEHNDSERYKAYIKGETPENATTVRANLIDETYEFCPIDNTKLGKVLA